MVRACDEPAGEAAQEEPHHVGDPLVAAQRGHLAEHAVAVGGASPRARFLASRRAWRSACWEVGGSGWSGVASLGTCAQSPSDHRWSKPSTRSEESTRMRPCSSTGSPRLEARAFARTPAVQTTVRVRSVSPSESSARPGPELGERRPDPDVDAPRRQLAGRVVAQAGGDLREDLLGRVDEHPVLRLVADLWVAAEGVPNEVRRARRAPRHPRTRRRRRRRSTRAGGGPARTPRSPPRAGEARGSGGRRRPRSS